MEILLIALFLLCMIIQIGFHWGVFYKILTHRHQSHESTIPPVSVIIAARNEEKNLAALLEALITQDHQAFEVIIVNDRSNDDTGKIIETYSARHPQFRSISISALPDGWNGKKYALFKATEIAQNQILLFTDADCKPESNQWISEMARNFTYGIDIVLGYSPYAYTPNSGVLNEFIAFETLLTGVQYMGFASIGQPYMGVGRNLAIRRNIYDRGYLKSIGHLTGGDDDLMVNHLANSQNTRLVYAKASQTTSWPKSSWRAYIRQKVRHMAAGRHYHKKDQTLLAVFTLSFLFGWIFLFLSLVSALNPYLILTAFGLRSLSFYTIFARVGQKFDAHLKIWALPFLDLCYSIYYPVVGLKALATKNIRWK